METTFECDGHPLRGGKRDLLIREEDDEGGREGEDGGDVEGGVHVLLFPANSPTDRTLDLGAPVG